MPSCAIATCTSTHKNSKEKGISFFHFPADPVLCKSWKTACKRADEINVKYALICSEHFEEHLIEGTLQRQLLGQPHKRTLVKGALPTLNLPQHAVQPSKQVKLSEERTGRQATRETRKRALERIKTISPKKKPPSVVSLSSPDAPCSSTHDTETVLPEIRSPTKSELTKQLAELQKENDKLVKENKLLKIKAKALKRKEAATRTHNNKLRRKLKTTDKLGKLQKAQADKRIKKILKSVFSPSQIRCILTKRRVTWDKEDILKALTLRALSRKSYLFVKKSLGIPFPGLSTLVRWTKNFQCPPGILYNVLEVMQSKQLDDFDKHCTLSFDEMNVDSRMCYDHQGDIIYGPCSNAQVAMLRVVFKNWKQPIYYEFDAQMTKSKLLEIISKVHDYGFNVMACVSDLGGKNSGVWTSLKITELSPSFTHPSDPSKKIWVFADIPHMVKLIRNHVLDEGIVLEDKTIINRNAFAELLEKDCGEMKLCPKLSLLHINCKGRERQRVYLATQLFSLHSAEAIRQLFPALSRYADFVKLVNDFFDIFNSSTKLHGSAVLRSGYGMAIEEQKKTLLTMRRECSRMRVSGKDKLLPFQKGILLSISSLLGLFEDISKIGGTYILTRRLNQDCLEHFFSQIRGLGHFYDHPLPSEFKARMRLLIIGANTSDIPVSSSIEQETEEIVTISEAMLDGKSTSSDEAEVLDDAEMRSLLDDCSELVPEDPCKSEQQQLCEAEGLKYVAGYIAARCATIDPSLGTKIRDLLAPTGSWIEKVSTVQGLTVPSEDWLELVKQFEVVFTLLHGNSINQEPKIIERLEEVLAAKYPRINRKVLRIYSRTRTFIRLKFLNKQLATELATRSKGSLKKAKKWLHSRKAK